MPSNPTNRPMMPLLLGVALLLTGCGPRSGRVALEGTITYKGQAVKEGSIQFEPIDSPQAYSAGAVIRDGKYTVAADAGLLPGKYSVKISSTAPIGRNSGEAGGVLVARELLPRKYNSMTELAKEVTPSPTNRIDFDLD